MKSFDRTRGRSVKLIRYSKHSAQHNSVAVALVARHLHDMMDPSERLRAMGLVLPDPPAPIGAYQAVVLRSGLGFVSGQLPFVGGTLLRTGRLGGEVDVAAGRLAARAAALNILAQITCALGGWDRLLGLCRLDGILATAPGFTELADVMDGASNLLLEILGPELGAHARSVSSAMALPGDAPIELVCTFATRSASGSAGGDRLAV